MTAPLVSVVVPTYNRAQMAGQAVASALAQTFGDLEVIVVDDGSDDDTPQIVTALSARDPRVRLVRLSHTGMPGLVRNRGVDVATGRYVAFLDSDDLWKRRKLERQLAALRAAASTDTPEPARLCHTRETWLRDGRPVRQPPAFDNRGGDLFARSLERCIIGPSTVVVERRLFGAYGGFREDLQVAEDYEFWLRITARESVAYVEEPLVLKRAGGWDQLSERYGQIEIFRIRALAELLCDRGLPSGAPAEAAGEAFRRTCARYAHGRRKRGDEASAALFDRLSEVDSAPSEEDLRALRAFECGVRIRVSATMVRSPAVLGQSTSSAALSRRAPASLSSIAPESRARAAPATKMITAAAGVHTPQDTGAIGVIDTPYTIQATPAEMPANRWAPATENTVPFRKARK